MTKKGVEHRSTQRIYSVNSFLLSSSAVALVLFTFTELFSIPTYQISHEIYKARKGGFVQAVLALQKVKGRVDLRRMDGSPGIKCCIRIC